MRVISSKLAMTRTMVIVLIVIIAVAGVATALVALKLRPSASLSTPIPTPTPAATATSSPSPTASPTPIPIANPTPTSTVVPTAAPTSAPTPTPKPTPTPSPTPIPPPFSYTHTASSTTLMTQEETGTSDYWNISVAQTYTVTVNDTIVDSSKPNNQQLSLLAESSLNDVNNNLWIWQVIFMNSTYFYYEVNTGQGNTLYGASCINGIVYVVVSNTSIEFIGSTANLVYYSSSYSFNNVFETLAQIQIENGGTDNFTSGNLNVVIQ
jgi:hypothetical protein